MEETEKKEKKGGIQEDMQAYSLGILYISLAIMFIVFVGCLYVMGKSKGWY